MKEHGEKMNQRQRLGQFQKRKDQQLAQFSEKAAITNYNNIFQTQKSMPQTTISQVQDTQSSIRDAKSTKPCFEQQQTFEKSKTSRQRPSKILQNRLTNESRDMEDFPEEESQSEVSLEQDLLDEHKMALEDLFLRTPVLSNAQMTASQNEPQLRWKNGIFKEVTLEYFLHLYLSKLKTVKPLLVGHFHSYLRQQKIFYRFLQHLYYSYPSHLVQLSLKYIIYTWELYNPCLKITLSSAQVQSAAQHIYEKMRRREEERQLGDSLELKAERRLVMKVIVMTVVLVMEKSFSNPYCQPAIKVQKTFASTQEQINQRECEDVLQKKVKQE